MNRCKDRPIQTGQMELVKHTRPTKQSPAKIVFLLFQLYGTWGILFLQDNLHSWHQSAVSNFEDHQQIRLSVHYFGSLFFCLVHFWKALIYPRNLHKHHECLEKMTFIINYFIKQLYISSLNINQINVFNKNLQSGLQSFPSPCSWFSLYALIKQLNLFFSCFQYGSSILFLYVFINLRIMATNKILRKFAFKDLNLAYKALITFDQNKNQLFDEQEICQALGAILGEDQNQLRYVVKNVFRYDRDGDKSVTYAELTNFCVQQHFGQMAIQRLHKKGYYVNGARRVMSLDEFQTTLNYCLSKINSSGTSIQYKQLFNEVDIDRDGLISYQDYFNFLREYFGSQSQVFFEEQSGHNRKPPNDQRQQGNYIDGNGQSPQERFAKLVYSQLKIAVMERDRNRNLLLQRDEIQDILSNVFKLTYSQQSQYTELLLNGLKSIKYEDFMRKSVTYYLGVLGPRSIQGQGISEKDFIPFMHKLCHFVSVKPADHVLIDCFKSSTRSPILSQSDFNLMIRSIFQNFKFDSRGLPVPKPISYRMDSSPIKSF